jgi:hypothetical protein
VSIWQCQLTDTALAGPVKVIVIEAPVQYWPGMLIVTELALPGAMVWLPDTVTPLAVADQDQVRLAILELLIKVIGQL